MSICRLLNFDTNTSWQSAWWRILSIAIDPSASMAVNLVPSEFNYSIACISITWWSIAKLIVVFCYLDFSYTYSTSFIEKLIDDNNNNKQGKYHRGLATHVHCTVQLNDRIGSLRKLPRPETRVVTTTVINYHCVRIVGTWDPYCLDQQAFNPCTLIS